MPSSILGVSVLICTRDRSTLLKDCLGAVLACSPPPSEVVVIDQSLDEKSRSVVKRYQGKSIPVRYFRGLGSGVSRAKNQGIAQCRWGIIAFTDDDCLVDPGWVDALTRPIRLAEAGAAVGRTSPERVAGSGQETFSYYAPTEAPVFSERTHPWRVGGGGNFAARKDVLERVGAFDERFGPGAPFESAEDMDLVHRLLRSGGKIVYTPTARVCHRSWRSAPANRRLSRAYGIGSGAYFAKYLLRGDWVSGWRLLARFGVRFLSLLTAALRGQGRRCGEQAVYLVGLLEGVGGYLRAGKSLPGQTPALERKEV